jgi:hypothetical protein
MTEAQQLIVYSNTKNPDVVIEGIHYDHVRQYNKRLYNSNNHWPLEQKPADYDSVIAKCNLTEWLSEFRTPGTYRTIDLPIQGWIREANHLGQQTGQISLLYYEDLNDYCAKYESDPKFAELFTPEALAKVGGGYFVRSNSVSLKNGIHGVGPYTNLRKIVESLITCNVGHNPMSDYQPDTDKSQFIVHHNDARNLDFRYGSGVPIYRTPHDTQTLGLTLFPWLDIQDEYRVFVHNRRVTAISQQDLGTPHPVMAQTDEPAEYARQVTEKILAECSKSVIPWLESTGRDSITLDFAFLGPNMEPYIVEFNPFGPEHAAGSSLFHWELNWDKLSSASGYPVYFRFTTI